MLNTQTLQTSTQPVLGKTVTTFPTIVIRNGLQKLQLPWLKLPAFGVFFAWVVWFLVKFFGGVVVFLFVLRYYLLRPHLSLADKGTKKEEGR